MAENLVALLRRSRERHAQRVLFGERAGAGWRWLTCGEFERGVSGYAEQLAELGARPGDRVVLAGPWSVTAAQLAHAVCRQRASFVPLSGGRELDAWRFILRHAEPRLVVSCDGTDRLVLEALQRESRASWRVVELHDCRPAANEQSARLEREPRPEQPASICYRRLSAGQYAPTVWTHRALCQRARSLKHTSGTLQRTLSEALLLRTIFDPAR
jgi:long-subunit acyl-CoA synthetase (AMP-forming)